MGAQVRRVDGLLPFPLFHHDTPALPVSNHLVHVLRVTEGVILAEEEQCGRRHRTVPEDVDSNIEVVHCLLLECAEVEHAEALHQAFKTWKNVFAQT